MHLLPKPTLRQQIHRSRRQQHRCLPRMRSRCSDPRLSRRERGTPTRVEVSPFHRQGDCESYHYGRQYQNREASRPQRQQRDVRQGMPPRVRKRRMHGESLPTRRRDFEEILLSSTLPGAPHRPPTAAPKRPRTKRNRLAPAIPLPRKGTRKFALQEPTAPRLRLQEAEHGTRGTNHK